MISKINLRQSLDRLWVSISSQRYTGVSSHNQNDHDLPVLESHPLAFSVSRIVHTESHSARNGSYVNEDMNLVEEQVGAADRELSSDLNPPLDPKHRWVSGIYLCAMGTACLLLVNVALVGVAAGLASNYSYSRVTSVYSSWRVIYRGSCTASSRWNTGAHLFVNVLSTCVLGASNYCMQFLVAPTRNEVDEAHKRGEWVTIGTMSLKNLLVIPLSRRVLWVLLLLTATPFHLLYNSVLIQSLYAYNTGEMAAPHDVDSQNIWHLTDPVLESCFKLNHGGHYTWHQFGVDVEEHRYQRITHQECSRVFSKDQAPDLKVVVYLTTDLVVSSGLNTSIFQAAHTGDETITINPFGKQFGENGSVVCFPWITVEARHDNFADGCLKVYGEEHCQLLYSPPICVFISLILLLKVIVIYLAARLNRSQSPPLLNVGDAVASFLQRPDYTTEKLCSVSWSGINTISQAYEKANKTQRRFENRRRWSGALGKHLWLVTVICWISWVTIGLAFSISKPLKSATREGGFLAASKQSYMEGNLKSVLDGALRANSVQLVITLSYYFYNTVLTSMLSAAEYNSYGTDRKPLRVTWPVKDSQQRSTYWISVPYHYGIPVMVLSIVLHWLVSQSFSFYLMLNIDADGQPTSISYWMNFTAIYGLVASILGLSMLLFLTGISFWGFKSIMPLPGSCSAAISAACHPPRDDSTETAALGPLMWGETALPPDWSSGLSEDIEGDAGHCGFTSLGTTNPSLKKAYA